MSWAWLPSLASGTRSYPASGSVLAGAFLLEMMAKYPELQKQMLVKLSAFLVREDDRALFGLRSVREQGSAT